MATAATAGRTVTVGMLALVVAALVAAALVVVAPELIALVVAAPTIAVEVMAVEEAQAANLEPVVAWDAARAATLAKGTEEAVGAALADDGTAPGTVSTGTPVRLPPARLRASAPTSVELQWCPTQGE